MPLRTREDYERALSVVREVINTWDPYNLVSAGAPSDEWDSEVASIVAQIPRIGSATDAAYAVARVFRVSLGDNFDAEACADVGAHVYGSLVAAGVLD